MSERSRRAARIGLLLLAVAVAIGLGTVVIRQRGDRPGAVPSASGATALGSARPPRRGGWQPVYLSGGEVENSGADAIGSFSGHVVSSADLARVPHAEITFVEAGAAHAVVSGADGSFVLQPPREGTYQIAAISAEGFVPFSAELGSSPLGLVARRGRAIKNVTLYLTPAVRYRGRVVDPKGQAVASASVRVLDDQGEPLGLAGAPASYSSDEKGDFEFQAPDGAVLEARHASFSPGRARLDFPAQVSRRVTIRLGEPGVAEPALSISGRVEDERGTPLGGVTVGATSERAGFGEQPALGARTRSGIDGRFELTGLAARTYTLLAQEPGSASVLRRGVRAPARDVVLRLGPGGTLIGRVVDGETERPFSAFTIVISERVGPLALDTVRAETSFDADGRYRIERLSRGRYVVAAAAHGYATSPEREIAISDGETSADFALTRGATLSGVVRDGETRLPLERAKISLEGRARPGGAEHGVPLLAVAISNARGEFSLSGLPLGEHSVLAAALGHHSKIVGPMLVRGPEPIGPIEVLLAPTADGEEPRIELHGIGAVLTAAAEVLRIEKIVEGGGAAEKDLRVGDEILAVDGVAITTLGFEGSIQRIRGPEGTFVTLTIRREGSASMVAVPRRRIRA